MSNFGNGSGLDEMIQQVKQEFKSFLIKRKELVLKLGNAFEKVVANPESICEEIKNALRDEISGKLISSRNIETYCPAKWKRKTKPKNEERSFSQDENHHKRIMIDTEGTLVKETTVTSHSKADNKVHSTGDYKQLYNANTVQEEIKKREIADINQCHNCEELRTKLQDYEEALAHVPFIAADQINNAKIKYRIPKEAHQLLDNAAQKCSCVYYVTFDPIGNLVSAEPDISSAK
jgi:hypothetical protein